MCGHCTVWSTGTAHHMQHFSDIVPNGIAVRCSYVGPYPHHTRLWASPRGGRGSSQSGPRFGMPGGQRGPATSASNNRTGQGTLTQLPCLRHVPLVNGSQHGQGHYRNACYMLHRSMRQAEDTYCFGPCVNVTVQPEVYHLIKPQLESSVMLLGLHHHWQEATQVLHTLTHGHVKDTQLGPKLIQHLLCALHREVAA